MDTDEYLTHVAELHALIVGSNVSSAWAQAADGSSEPPQWQRDVLSKILALTFDQQIQYISTATPDDDDWDIVAFTDATVVRVVVVRDGNTVPHTEAFAFPRSSLESLELLDVDTVPRDAGSWPSELTLIGHYRAATINLPLDRFASGGNKQALALLLTSLLQDLNR
jgi:hypothetical protein